MTGVAQGVITGIRGLCNGLGPALYGLVFYVFHVNLNEDQVHGQRSLGQASNLTQPSTFLHDLHEVRVTR